MYTEDEAKEKWCPFGRVTDTDGVPSHNRFFSDASNQDVPQTMCIGPACMAWRWAGVASKARIERFKGYIANTGTTLAEALEAVPEDDTRRGYCGLSGEPK